MKKIVLLILFLFYGNVHAEILNGSFEYGLTGFSGHEGSGDVEVYQSLGSGLVLPTDGSYFLYLSTGPGDVDSDGSPDMSKLSADPFVIETGVTTLSFDFNILTEQDTPHTFFYDYAHVEIRPAYALIANCTTASDRIYYMEESKGPNHEEYIFPAFIPLSSEIFTLNGSHYTKQTGWYHAVFDVRDRAGIGIDQLLYLTVGENPGSQFYDTALLIDNISLNTSPCQVSPHQHDFGIVGVGYTVIQQFAVTNFGNSNIDVSDILITGSFASDFHIENDNCSGKTIGPSETLTFDVVFQPDNEGFKDGKIVIPFETPFILPLEILLTSYVREICAGDFDGDGDVDGTDLAVFASDFGRTDCPILENNRLKAENQRLKSELEAKEQEVKLLRGE